LASKLAHYHDRAPPFGPYLCGRCGTRFGFLEHSHAAPPKSISTTPAGNEKILVIKRMKKTADQKPEKQRSTLP